MDTLFSVSLNGGYFSPGTELTLFPYLKANKGLTRLTLIYGRNGSGKSSLAKALDDAAHDISNPKVSCVLMSEDSKPCSNSRDILKAVHIFDENYINKHVMLSEDDALDAIVLLGEAGELEEELEDKQKLLVDINGELKTERETLISLTGDDEGSVANLRSKALTALKGNGSWADRDSRIKDKSRKSSVTDTTFDRICQIRPSERSLADLYQEFEGKLRELQSLNASEHISEVEIPSVPSLDDSLQLASILGRRIESPTITSRDVRVLEIASALGMSFISDAKTYFTNSTKKYCPFCMRDISTGETGTILGQIELALRGDAQAHVEEVKLLRPVRCEIDKSNLPHMAERGAVDEASTRIDEFNNVVERLQGLCDRKAENPFVPISIDGRELFEHGERLIEAVESLNDWIRTHNQHYDRRNELTSSLSSLNEKIARLEMDDTLSTWKEAENLARTKSEKVSSLEAMVGALQEDVNNINTKLANTQIALDLINRYLAQVFMDDEHIVLKGANGRYKLFSHGHPVSPSEVSAGERNAIALCNFIAEIGQGGREEERFVKPRLLILDDPISSFDYENKIGIVTLIRNLIVRALRDCSRTKILILTHDAQLAHSFRTLKKEVEAMFKGDAKRKFQVYGPVELIDKELRDWSGTEVNYAGMMNDVCAYARGERKDLTPYIGNVTRRLLEGFSTFEFNKGIDVLTMDDDVLNRVPKKRRGYFVGLMGRLALHDASHLVAAVNDEGSLITYNHYSPATLKAIAGDTIELMYHLARSHVESHLNKENMSYLIDRLAKDT